MSGEDDRVCVVDALQPDGRPLTAHAAMACLEGDLDALKKLVEPLNDSDVKDLFWRNGWPDGMTLLKMAVLSQHLDVVKYMVIDKDADPEDNGADPDKTPDDYQEEGDMPCLTPFHLAAQVGNLEILRVLYNAVSQPSMYQIDRNGLTVFHHACMSGSLACVKFLLEDSNMTKEPFSLELCQNHADMCGETGLMRAVRTGNLQVVSYLLENGADKDKQNKEGKNSVDIARECSIDGISALFRGGYS